MKHRLPYIALCLALLMASLSFAQRPFYNHFTTKDGLPSMECYDILQDSTGFIWIATDRGLARFDVSTIRSFTNKDGLPGNVVTTLHPAWDDNIWASCYEKGIAHTDGFSITVPAWSDSLIQRNDRIHDFLDLGPDELFIGYRSMGTRPTLFTTIKGEVIEEETWQEQQNLIIVSRQHNLD